MSYSLAQEGHTISMANRRLEYLDRQLPGSVEKDSHRHRRKRLILREAADMGGQACQQNRASTDPGP